MSNDVRWQRLQDLFHRALDREPSRRAEFLDNACADDAELRADVDRLLSANDQAAGFIDAPVISSAMDDMRREDT